MCCKKRVSAMNWVMREVMCARAVYLYDERQKETGKKSKGLVK